MEREEIVKDATKYVEQFKGRIFVIKYGGSILDDEVISDSILDDIICFHKNGIRVVLVHGGGSSITKLMQQRGKEPKFVSGLRVTDEETAHIADEALTLVNSDLVYRISRKGVNADSVISRESLTIKAKKKHEFMHDDFVGDVESVDIRYIDYAIKKNSIAVVSPVGVDGAQRLYNINADLAAAEISAALSAEKFIMITNVKGVMREKSDESSLISTLKEEEAIDLIEKGIIGSGMIPKVQSGILALDKGVAKVHIISGRIEHSLLTEVFTDKGIGTEIIK